MLNLFTSNRLEILTDILSDILQAPMSSPLAPEMIVVQSKGMERWISAELARRHGIAANIRFPFPNAFAEDLFARLMPDIPESSPFDPGVMTWKIMKLLPRCIDLPEFSSLRNYIGKNEDLKRFQLSSHIADVFDQYLLFRPEMILDWDKGNESDWQALLWRKLSDGRQELHRASLAKLFLKKLRRFSGDIGLPPRVAVFGISALPRFYVELFAALSERININLFLMNPCAEHWGDILNRREIRRIIRKSCEIDRNQLYLWQGNSLLSSMGTLGRDFFNTILEFDYQEDTSFEDPEENSMLACIQSDIMNLREREQTEIDAQDTSIRVHSCHSPMRELQVLLDSLLDMFERYPDLKPSDILVMTPDIEAYSPYIQAVFDLPRDDSRKIPFSIADRTASKESRLIESFLLLSDLHGSRFSSAQVIDILENQAIYQRFGLSEGDLAVIRRWIEDTRIRWGIDEHHRASCDLPDFPQNTWKAGIDRLLLGYAMPGYGEKLFAGILPYDHIEGDETIILGKFLEFVHRLFSMIHALEYPKTLSRWAELFKNILEDFFISDEVYEREIRKIRDCLNALEKIRTLAEFDETVDIRVIRNYLSSCLTQEGFGFGFITGGVTFCAMLPMRSIPAQVICLIGMNHDAYPRRSERPGFDLIAKYPRPGDRSRRNDDRYLFLESLLSARKCFYISYAGQSIQDNSVIPPSVLVSELMDYIEKYFQISEKHIIHEHILVKHRLQAFSRDYFEERVKCEVLSVKKEQRLFSYSEEYRNAAEALLLPKKQIQPFISEGLSEPEPERRTVDVNDLASFFSHPTRFLLQKRLGLYPDETDAALSETESFDIKGLDQYLINRDILEKCLNGIDPTDFFKVKTAAGELPHGTVGECAYQNFSNKIKYFSEKLMPYFLNSPQESVDIDETIADFRIVGRIEDIRSQHLIRFRYASITPKDRLSAWIHHLLLNLKQAMFTILIGSDKTIEYQPVKEPCQIIEHLLMRYWQGLRKPLHFFPKSSFEYAQALINGKSRTEASEKAGFVWNGDEYHRGEKDDPYYRLCFRDEYLPKRFGEIAEEIFEPMLN